MLTLEDNAVFSVKEPTTLSSADELRLVSCYLPLIGSAAYAVYHVLETIKIHKDEPYFFATYLSESTGLSLTELSDSLRKLEAVGLITAYRYEDASKVYYVYRMYLPLLPELFFKNEMLTGLLVSKIGERRVKELLASFTSDDRISPEYQDVTASFSDVFDLTPDYSSFQELSGKALEEAVKEERAPIERFNLDKFKEELKKLSVDPETLAAFYADIVKTSLLFGLNEGVAAEIVKGKALSSSGEFSLATYQKNASNFTHFHLEDRKDDIKGSEFGSGDLTKRMSAVNNMSPIDFLNGLLKSDAPETYRTILKDLSFKYGLSDPLINVVVDYTIQKCKGFLPEKYAFIIASGLNSNKITSPSSAWSFLYQNENERVARKKEKEEFKAAPAEEAEKPEEGEKKKKKKVNIDDIVGDQF